VRTLEDYAPRRGVSIPCITCLARGGEPNDADQRRLVRYLIQGGSGADVIFAMGTTGEWNKLDQARRHRVIRVVVEETRKHETRLVQAGERPVEAWVGLTAPSRAETLETVELALEIGAHAGVIAPLAIKDVDDPVRFVARDLADLLDARGKSLPVFLYDNADISAGREPHLRTKWVKQLSRLDFVRGIKVSAPPRKLGHYTKAARQFRDLGSFAIYVGDALHILQMMRPETGFLGWVREHWNRFLLHDVLPAGVVSGPANVFPREWQRAWRVACAGDVERMDELARQFRAFSDSYRFPAGKRSLAALKRGLFKLGVLSSDVVAKGTAAFSADEASQFDAAFEKLVDGFEATLPERWRSDPACAEEP
jgi:dihydrodipicolinate synthase/N-acetylneuraminate lyase